MAALSIHPEAENKLWLNPDLWAVFKIADLEQHGQADVFLDWPTARLDSKKYIDAPQNNGSTAALGYLLTFTKERYPLARIVVDCEASITIYQQ